MSRFEYKNSISINCLVKLTVLTRVNNQTEELDTFDQHAKGLELYDVIELLDRYKEKKDVGQKVIKVSSKESESTQVIYDIREDIKTAITDEVLIVDKCDTKDCNEYRINYESALKWCEKYHKVKYIFDVKEVKLKNIYLTLAALLKLNKDQTKSSQEKIVHEVQLFLDKSGQKTAETTISRIFTESNNRLK